MSHVILRPGELMIFYHIPNRNSDKGSVRQLLIYVGNNKMVHGFPTSSFFTEQEIKVLELNPSVLCASEKNITYSPVFKIAAVEANHAGHTPMEIFVQTVF